jgi:serine/threonine protein kinase
MRQPGEVVAGFRIERLLGTGGMGEVYLVHHPRLPRLDALKLLPAAASADPSFRERFQREADLAAGLDHDNVVTVYDRGETDGQLWIHMKYVAGEDAAAALRSGGPFTTERALHTIARVASALDDAHRHGLLHRDVKPANILIGKPAADGEPERVFLTDFGIAKGVGDAVELTPNGHFAASLDYAAPEQIQLQPLDGRADQYALGCVLFQLLTGAVPYPGDGAWARMNAHLASPVPSAALLRPGLPPGVQAVLDRAMAKDPRDRFESCGAMASALAEALQGASAPAAATSTLPFPRPPDASETPPPSPTPLPAAPAADPWWRPADRAAVASLVAAVGLSLVSAFPPTSALSVSRYPAELHTGQFAASQLPALLLVLVAVGLQLTRSGHRYRWLLYGVAAGAGVFAAIDSLRVYSFTQANHGGAYDSALSRTNGALPRLVIALLVVIVALAGVMRAPARPRSRLGAGLPFALVLAACAVVLAALAVMIGPAIQKSRLHQFVYGVPLGSTLAAAALLALAAMTRRPPVLIAAVTVSAIALIAGLTAPSGLRYPMALVGDVFLLVAAGVLYAASTRPAPDLPGPSAPPPGFWEPPTAAQHPWAQNRVPK